MCIRPEQIQLLEFAVQREGLRFAGDLERHGQIVVAMDGQRARDVVGIAELSEGMRGKAARARERAVRLRDGRILRDVQIPMRALGIAAGFDDRLVERAELIGRFLGGEIVGDDFAFR
jgi:hypothetical protein